MVAGGTVNVQTATLVCPTARNCVLLTAEALAVIIQIVKPVLPSELSSVLVMVAGGVVSFQAVAQVLRLGNCVCVLLMVEDRAVSSQAVLKVHKVALRCVSLMVEESAVKYRVVIS
jgi:hypothetical protein